MSEDRPPDLPAGSGPFTPASDHAAPNTAPLPPAIAQQGSVRATEEVTAPLVPAVLVVPPGLAPTLPMPATPRDALPNASTQRPVGADAAIPPTLPPHRSAHASPTESRRAGSAWRVVVVAVLLVALLAGLGAGAGLVVSGAQEAARAAAGAAAYCTALQHRQYAQAYGLLTPGAQHETSSANFMLTAQLHDEIDGAITHCAVPQPGLGAGFSFGLGATHETLDVQIVRSRVWSGTIALVKVGQHWLVDGVSASLVGTDVGPLLVERQLCSALEHRDYSSAEQQIASGMRAQVPATALPALFGNSAATALTGCQADLGSYHLSADGRSAQVRVPLTVTPQGAVQPLTMPVMLTFTRQPGWAVAGVQLAVANLPPVTSLAPFGAPHLPRSAPPAPVLTSAAALLVNPATNEVYLAQNADAERAMASTTKIMTAVVALTIGRLDQGITVSPEVAALDNGIASVAGLRVGDVLTLRDLLYALLVPSGDDAAVAIADGLAGSQAAFVALMNMEAGLLGLHETHFANVHGLDAPSHYTSARDLLRLTEYAMRYAAFTQIVGTATWQVHGYCWTTTNQLLPNLNPCPGVAATPGHPGVTGVKTGYTGNAGGCLVFSAQQGSRKLLGVVLGEPSGQTDTARFTDGAALLTWGFALEQRGL